MLGVIGDQPAQVRLVLEHAELVQPEPCHLFLQLRRRIDRAQHFDARGLIRELLAVLVERLARGRLGVAVRHRLDALLLRAGLAHQGGRRRPADLQSADGGRDRRRQCVVLSGELFIEKAPAAKLLEARDRGAVDAERDPAQPLHVACGRCRGRSERLRRGECEQRCGQHPRQAAA